MVEPSVMRTVFTTVLWASGFDSYQTQLTLTGHGYLIESDIWEECSLSNTSCGCFVSRTFSWLSPPWWEQFSRRSYELLALILTKLSSLWRAMATWLKAIFGRSVACRIPVVGVLCLVHSHGWALRDENSFHDGLMSFWLWFLPNSAHSDGQVLFCMPGDLSHELRLHTFAIHFDLLHPSCAQSHRGVCIVASWC